MHVKAEENKRNKMMCAVYSVHGNRAACILSCEIVNAHLLQLTVDNVMQLVNLWNTKYTHKLSNADLPECTMHMHREIF